MCILQKESVYKIQDRSAATPQPLLLLSNGECTLLDREAVFTLQNFRYGVNLSSLDTLLDILSSKRFRSVFSVQGDVLRDLSSGIVW
jgi:hypothetical protein